MKRQVMCLAAAVAAAALQADCSRDAEDFSSTAKGARQRDAVAAAYALRTPDRAVRFADGWAFAKAVYGCGLSGGASTNLVVADWDGARNPGGKDAAIARVAKLLEPGDLVVSDGTNVCFYAGDVYGDGRGKVLATDPSGAVCEWDVGTFLFNWPHNQRKLAAAERFAMLRPLNCADAKIAERRRFPKGEGEPIADERVRAAVATAWAHYLKNECTQYDSIGMVGGDVKIGSYEKWSRKDRRRPIEDCTPDRTYYTVCSSFAYEVYYGAFGYGIGDDHRGFASFQLTQFPPPDILVCRYERGAGGKPAEEVLKEARAALRPGDVISYANVAKKKAGHVMIYIGEVDGIGTILHSTGQKFDFQNGFDKVEYEGTVVKNDVDGVLFTKGSPRYLLKFDQFVILRPLKKESLALTAAGRARATHPKFRYDRRVEGGLYGSVEEGGRLRYSVEVFNAATEPCDATVRETLPEGTELVSCTDGATAATNSVAWPITLRPGERRMVEWTVRAKAGTAGSFIVAAGGSAGGIPSNVLRTQVVARKVSVEEAFRWADENLVDGGRLPACRVRDWCGGFRTAEPPMEERVRETRSRDLMPGDVVAVWTKGRSKPSSIWVRDDVGLLERVGAKGQAASLRRVPEERVAALLAADRFQAFRPAAEP
ncbi:MAG: DUF11 domain-containing protein [Kiritimatiellae bacterium]|nr:DUF11 domain-containing protein [Kiritimatiellia bacterium]